MAGKALKQPGMAVSFLRGPAGCFSWKNEMRCLLYLVSLCSASVGAVVRFQQAHFDGCWKAPSLLASGCVQSYVVRAGGAPCLVPSHGFRFEWLRDSDSNPG